jgi:hypothetical protein
VVDEQRSYFEQAVTVIAVTSGRSDHSPALGSPRQQQRDNREQRPHTAEAEEQHPAEPSAIRCLPCCPFRKSNSSVSCLVGLAKRELTLGIVGEGLNGAACRGDRQSPIRDAVAPIPIAPSGRASALCQLTHITKDRGALTHDDRLNAVVGAVAHFQWAMMMDIDQATKAIWERGEAGGDRGLP